MKLLMNFLLNNNSKNYIFSINFTVFFAGLLFFNASAMNKKIVRKITIDNISAFEARIRYTDSKNNKRTIILPCQRFTVLEVLVLPETKISFTYNAKKRSFLLQNLETFVIE